MTGSCLDVCLGTKPRSSTRAQERRVFLTAEPSLKSQLKESMLLARRTGFKLVLSFQYLQKSFAWFQVLT